MCVCVLITHTHVYIHRCVCVCVCYLSIKVYFLLFYDDPGLLVSEPWDVGILQSDFTTCTLLFFALELNGTVLVSC